MMMNNKRDYPCDGQDGVCPYGDGNGTYFCRDNCGFGVDEDIIDEESIHWEDEDGNEQKRLEICD